MEELALREAALLARPATPDRAPAEEEYGRIRMQQEIRSRTGAAGFPSATVVFPRGEVRGLAAGRSALQAEALRLAEIFRANVVDSTLESFVFEMTGTPEKIDAFADLMRPLGLREIARTGVAALSRGA